MYPFIRRHDACSKLQLSRVRGKLDELALFLKPTEEGAGGLRARCLDKVQPPLRARIRSIQELQMRFDLGVLVAEAVARRSLHHLLPARLLPLIKTCEKIDSNHLCKVSVAALLQQSCNSILPPTG